MKYYSKRELYALGETLGDSVTEHKVGGGRIYGGGGKGGGGGTQQSTGTTYTSNVPEYARPYVETMLGATQKQLFDMEGNEITGFKPYKPYSTDVNDYVAGFSPLQQQAMQATGQLQTPGQLRQASGLAGMSGLGAMGAAQQAMGAGQQFQNMATNPYATQAYMSPYMQNVVDYQKSQALRDFQIGQPMRRSQAVGQGAFGGSRQAIMEAEAERALGSQLQGITATGSQKAFEDAQKQQQFGAQLGMQGLQTGLQGYGQMGQAAGTLGQLGQQQFGLQKDIIGMQSQMGREQQAMEQQKINQAIQDWANTQQYPLMQLGVMSNMLRGLPMQSQTTNQYVAAPNAITQGIGLAGAGASIFNALKKEGGVIKEMASGGITSIPRYDVGGEIESKLYDMQPDDLNRYIKESSSPSVKRMAQRILKEKTNLAGGGIIAFANPNEANNQGVVKEEFDPSPTSYLPGTPFINPNKAANKLTDEQIDIIRNRGSLPLNPRQQAAKQASMQEGPKTLAKDFPAELSYAADKARTDFQQEAIKQGARPLPREFPNPELTNEERIAGFKAAIEGKSTNTPAAPAPAAPATGIKTAAPAAAAPATTGAGTGIKATPSDKIMPTAGIKLPDTGVPGLQMPVAPVDPDAGKTTAQIAADKEAYMGPNAGAREAMAKLMAERANSVDEARRISALRMAEFFGAWGSTPGNTIVAGLNTLKNKVPDLIGDIKEATKIRRQIDKDISEIEKIERLEKSGNYDEAAKRKAELGKNALTKYGYDVKAYSDAQQTAATIKAASIRASVAGGGEGGVEKRLVDAQRLVAKVQADIASEKSKKEYTDAKRFSDMTVTDKTSPLMRDKINAAKKTINEMETRHTNSLNEAKNLVKRYSGEAGLSGGESNAGAPGTAGNPIKLQ